MVSRVRDVFCFSKLACVLASRLNPVSGGIARPERPIIYFIPLRLSSAVVNTRHRATITISKKTLTNEVVLVASSVSDRGLITIQTHLTPLPHRHRAFAIG